jgi:hypothetical protein
MKKLALFGCLCLLFFNQVVEAQILRISPLMHARIHYNTSYNTDLFGGAAGKNTFSAIGFEKMINPRYSLILDFSSNFSLEPDDKSSTAIFEHQSNTGSSIGKEEVRIKIKYWLRSYYLSYESRFYAIDRENGSAFVSAKIGLLYSSANYIYKEVDFGNDARNQNFIPEIPRPLSGKEVRWIVPLAFKTGFVSSAAGRLAFELWASVGYNFFSQKRAQKDAIRVLYRDARPYSPLLVEFGLVLPINLKRNLT